VVERSDTTGFTKKNRRTLAGVPESDQVTAAQLVAGLLAALVFP
jgi:hypothetical protein